MSAKDVFLGEICWGLLQIDSIDCQKNRIKDWSDYTHALQEFRHTLSGANVVNLQSIPFIFCFHNKIFLSLDLNFAHFKIVKMLCHAEESF